MELKELIKFEENYDRDNYHNKNQGMYRIGFRILYLFAILMSMTILGMFSEEKAEFGLLISSTPYFLYVFFNRSMLLFTVAEEGRGSRSMDKYRFLPVRCKAVAQAKLIACAKITGRYCVWMQVAAIVGRILAILVEGTHPWYPGKAAVLFGPCIFWGFSLLCRAFGQAAFLWGKN